MVFWSFNICFSLFNFFVAVVVNSKSNKVFISQILILLFLIVISLDFYLFGGYQEYLLFFLFTILGIITIEHFSAKKN